MENFTHFAIATLFHYMQKFIMINSYAITIVTTAT